MKLVVPTRLMAVAAEGGGLAKHQIHIANYGIDPARDGVLEARKRAGAVELYEAIFVGRFHAQKGLDDLIAVWKRVQLQIPDARLAVIGAGTGVDATEFTRQLGELDPGTVTLLGVQTGRDKYIAMAQSRVLLFPSHHESWGLVALEAMAAGLPVVGYDLPSSNEAFGDAMLQVASYDVDAFAAAVLQILCDERTRNGYRHRGYRVAKKYDWNRIANQFVADVISSAHITTVPDRSVEAR